MRRRNQVETTKNIAQIVYYLALSISGPLAVIVYLKAHQSDRQEREYKTYDELDNRFFEYQKLALQYYDLDILDVPNNDPSLAFDKKRKQEMVAYSILFSLFERTFLMFFNQTDAFQLRQWSGWSSASLSSTSRMTTGTSCSPARCAARQRRSPAMISKMLGSLARPHQQRLHHALFLDRVGQLVELLGVEIAPRIGAVGDQELDRQPLLAGIGIVGDARRLDRRHVADQRREAAAESGGFVVHVGSLRPR